MAISAAGHVALRLVGSRFGLPLAGFFAGFVSSTAAIAGFGQRLREQPSTRRSCVAAAQAAALASLLLALPVLGTVASLYLKLVLPQLLAFGAVLAVAVLMGLRANGAEPETELPTAASRMFRLSHALVFALLIAGVLLLSAFLQERFGQGGALLTSAIAALIELHAAMASIAQLGGSGALDESLAEWALQAVLLSSVLARSAVAFTAGGRAYGVRVGGVLGLAWLASALAVAL